MVQHAQNLISRRGWLLRMLPAIAVVAILFSGCASRKEVRKFQTDHVEFRSRLENLDTQFDEFDQRLARVESTVDTLRDLLGGNVSDYLKAQEELIRAVRADQNAVTSDLSRRIVHLSSQFSDSEERLQKLINSIDTFNQLVAEVLGDSVAGSAYEAAEAQRLFQQAYSDVLMGETGVARMGFQMYAELYPATNLADDALYWVGETYLAEAEIDSMKLDSARVAYVHLENRYPDSNHLAGALLKRGIIRARQGHFSGARRLFEQVVMNWPETDEADQARQWLADISDKEDTVTQSELQTPIIPRPKATQPDSSATPAEEGTTTPVEEGGE